MKVLFELSHPKHYYQFRYLINYYKGKGDEVVILARKKDVLLNVLEEDNHQYIILGKHGKGLMAKFTALPKLLLNYLKIIRKLQPDLLFSKASPYVVLLKPFVKGKIIITPDSEVVFATKLIAPLSDIVITPGTYTLNYGKNHHRIDGFFEEAYLSPKSFTPKEEVVRKLSIDPGSRYFVLRFVSWEANHDVGQFGFSDAEKVKLVNRLKNYGKVYISAERTKLPPELKDYFLSIPATAIHHVLYYANLYIGDSQTMATESALLGTPSLRYNSFVGENDMSNFIILEKKYELMRNFRSFAELEKELVVMLDDKELKKDQMIKKEKYFKGKDDINEQILKIVSSGK